MDEDDGLAAAFGMRLAHDAHAVRRALRAPCGALDGRADRAPDSVRGDDPDDERVQRRCACAACRPPRAVSGAMSDRPAPSSPAQPTDREPVAGTVDRVGERGQGGDLPRQRQAAINDSIESRPRRRPPHRRRDVRRPRFATLPRRTAHSSSGLGHRPLTAAARVRIPYGP